jgi:Carbohydrate binding domain
MSSVPALARLVTHSTLHPRAAVVRGQYLLVLAGLALPLTSAPGLDRQILVGGVAVYLSDVIVGLAVVSYFAVRSMSGSADRAVILRTSVLGWPLLAFAMLLVPGILRGHERFGASLVGQPLRLVVYAGIALAMTEIRPRAAYRGITAVFYAGTMWQLVIAAYHVATGTSQTPINELSTGGTRVLSLTTAMYLAAALVLALLNLELDRRRRWRFFHLGIAALAAAGVALSYSRTTYLALLLILPFLIWHLRGVRAAVRRLWPLWAALLVAAAVGIAVAAPQVGSRLADRVTANPLTDHSVRWRARGIEAALAGMRSGEWRPADQLALDPAANYLVNGGFESGVGGWFTQNASLRTFRAAEASFGDRSLEMVTSGVAYDEGLYSAPVVAVKGQTWTFSIWLQGAVGGESMNVAIWQYDNSESGVGQVNFPVTLSTIPTKYVVTTTITNPKTTHIRALVRTFVENPERYTIRADLASLHGDERAAGAHALLDEGEVVGPIVAPGGGWDALVRPIRPVDGNELVEPGFEAGTQGWSIQGGTLATVGALESRFGHRSAEVLASGNNSDEGIYSDPVPAAAGQLWRFSMWLSAAVEDERANISIWQYDAAGKGRGQSNLPVVLSPRPTRYSLMARITDPRTVAIRALVRTREAGSQMRIEADNAALQQVAVFPVIGDSGTGTGGSSLQLDEPLLGLGFGRDTPYVWEGKFYRVAGDPDNSYVFLLAGGGILALGGFLALLAFFLRDLVRRLHSSAGTEHALLVWVAAAWFILLVNCAMAPFLPRPKLVLTMWVLMLLPALVGRGRKRLEETD